VLYAGAGMWHKSAVRHLLPYAAIVVLALAGCASPQQKGARMIEKAQRMMQDENTRTTEHLRMQAIENGEVNSQRGAALLYPDYGRAFDPNHYTASAIHSYGTKDASTKGYDAAQQYRVDNYQTHDFYGSKADSAAQKKYATTEANSKGKYLIPNGSKAFDTKTAATKETWDAHKLALTKELADSRRPYLGKESKKMHQTVSAKDLADWRNGETVTYSDGEIDKVSTLKPLSIEDVRDLLNKSK